MQNIRGSDLPRGGEIVETNVGVVSSSNDTSRVMVSDISKFIP
jgi:hypothetical protein